MTYSPSIPASFERDAACSDLAAEARTSGARVEPCARPIAFEGCFGYLHSAGGDVGVVVCGAWGYEALCAHRASAEFGQMLADAGYPTLRFDYPGAANSKGDLSGRTPDDWIASVSCAAAALRRNSGAERIVLAGFGLGCLIALAAAGAGFEAAGFILLGPPTSGSRYIRETRAFAAMVAAPNDGGDLAGDGALSIAGFVMPAAFAAQVRALDLTSFLASPPAFALIATKPDGDAGPLVDTLGARGARIEQIAFEGYSELLAGPMMTKAPTLTFRRIVAAFAERCPVRAPVAAPSRQYPPAAIVDDDIVEEAVRFGEGGRLFGVLCRPRLAREGAPVAIMINVGRNSHVGWRRMPVDNARALARRGIASLRFDIGGIGESARRAGQPDEILYSEWPVLDMVEAIDFVTARNFGPVALVGVCSGAYIALQTAVADARVAGVVSVNLFRVVWDPADSVELILRFGNRPMTAAVTRMFSRDRLWQVASGEFDARPGLLHLIRRARRRFGVATMGWFGAIGPRGSLYAECLRRFDILRARGVETTLAYSAGDEGYDEIEDYFGRGGRRLSAYPNVRLATLDNCDHNLTPPHAGSWLVGQIESVVARTLQRKPV